MIKKVRKPGQERVRTSAHSVRNTGPSGMTRKRPSGNIEKPESQPIPKDELINIDDIILE